jgi:IMP dehydrogenase
MASINSTPSYTFDDVLLRPQFSEINSREDVDVSVEIVPGIKLTAPLMAANMQTVTSVKLAVALCKAGGMATIDQFRSIEDQINIIKDVKKEGCSTAGAVGTSRDFMERAEALVACGVTLIIMDTPHAHNMLTKNAISEFRKKFKDFPLIVGNIATREAARFLIDQGVDGIKIGIGPGAACLTRVNTGAGMPQITAIMECFDIANNHSISVIADGGIKMPGSFAKAIAAGGTAAFMGSVFAGSDESPGDVIEQDGKKFKEYFGSSSVQAKIKRAESDKNFKQSATRFVEGDAGLTKYNGTVSEIVENYVMGLKSAMSYVGARNIRDFQEKAVFSILTQNGVAENGAHGLV